MRHVGNVLIRVLALACGWRKCRLYWGIAVATTAGKWVGEGLSGIQSVLSSLSN